MSIPQISIITIVFNRQNDIEYTIKSITNQSFTNYEYIIIDGKSTDGTIDIINQYKNKIHQIISEKDNGIYDAMNKGLALAKGEYVLFINGGDELYDNFILENIFAKNRSEDIIYGECMLIDEQRQNIALRSKVINKPLPQKMDKYIFKNGTNISHQSIMVKRKIAPKYNLQYSLTADINWMLDSIINANSFYKTEYIISKFLIGGASKQQHLKSLHQRYLVFKNHYGFLKTILFHFQIIISKLKK